MKRPWMSAGFRSVIGRAQSFRPAGIKVMQRTSEPGLLNSQA
jgi:hypothetical protein